MEDNWDKATSVQRRLARTVVKPYCIATDLPDSNGELMGPILATGHDGTADLSSVLSHVVLLEQSMTNLQTTTSQLKTDLQVTKQDLESTKTELQSAKTDLRNTQTDLQTSKSLRQLASAEMSSLKDEVASLKAELKLSANELNQVKSELRDMKQDKLNANFLLNLTMDAMGHNIKLNTVQVNTLQSSVSALDNHLHRVNTTLYDVKTEEEAFILNTSSSLKVITDQLLFGVREMVSTKEVQQNASKQLERLQNEMNQTSVDVRNVQQALHMVTDNLHTAQSNITSTIADVADLQRSMSRVQSQSQGNTKSLSQVIQDVASKTRTVAFRTESPPDTAIGTPLVFDFTIYNVNSCYDDNTGKFTAPVSGTYMFYTNLSLKVSNTFGTYIHIMKTGSNIIGFGTAKTGSDHTAAFSVAPLRKGEQVWVETTQSMKVEKSSSASSFGGFLVSVD
ncbi:multimerin-2-like [Haliotis rubra]|uniref:multimerin-2-like n=1 Tax=Haliotis rubra TaxID=36100 RepID=UPI001EE5A886|nr:multimerin-2-like [Haliotis rubra]